MPTECNGCGGCCRGVTLSHDWVFYMLLTKPEVPDPAAPENSGYWTGGGWAPELGQEYVADARHISKHFHYIGDDDKGRPRYDCDRLGADNRCMAYEERPPICRGFPHYYGSGDDMADHLPLECEFYADVSPDKRPPGWKPVLLTTKPVV